MKVCGVTNSVCKMKFPTLYAIVEELGNAEVFDCVRLMLHRPVRKPGRGNTYLVIMRHLSIRYKCVNSSSALYYKEYVSVY